MPAGDVVDSKGRPIPCREDEPEILISRSKRKPLFRLTSAMSAQGIRCRRGKRNDPSAARSLRFLKSPRNLRAKTWNETAPNVDSATFQIDVFPFQRQRLPWP